MYPLHKIIWRWMSTQYIMDQINLLVYLVRQEDNTMIILELKKMMSNDIIFCGISMTGELYQTNN